MFFKTPVITESNAASVLHRLSGGKPWGAQLRILGTYLCGTHVLCLEGSVQLVGTVLILEGVFSILLYRNVETGSVEKVDLVADA